jgi:hypothetical protein
VGEGREPMKTNLPALRDAEPRPDARCYELATHMLRGHSIPHYHWARDFLAVAIWMEAKNTLDFILGVHR